MQSAIDHWPFCSLTAAHINRDFVRPDMVALGEWFDQGRGTDALFQEVDLVPDVPLQPPDEPYFEFDSEEFFRVFGYDLPEDYTPASFPESE